MHTEFQVNKLNDAGLLLAQSIAQTFDDALTALEKLLGQGTNTREAALMRTKLEESCFFAKKAMAQASVNQASVVPTPTPVAPVVPAPVTPST